MMLLRSINSQDLQALYDLSKQAGVGLTTLPADHDLLAEKLELAVKSFQDQVDKSQALYFFVLEDLDTNKLVGCCAIEAEVGARAPFYSYRVASVIKKSEELKIFKEVKTLNLVNDYHGSTELCTLFLQKEYRKHNYGRMLSLSRFLYMAQHPNKFSDMVIAEIRGVCDDQGYSPFWRSVGANFFGMNFPKADYLTAVGKKQFIADLLPKYPVYVNLLPLDAQEVIGSEHPNARGARSLLESEGFMYRGYVDIFDGGPTLEAPLRHIRSINKSKLYTVSKIEDKLSGDEWMVANSQLLFRMLVVPIKILDPANIAISAKAAEALKVDLGYQVRVLKIEEQ